ncbi:MAG: UDP binding domain-containing protein, partial [Thermoplasmata archaeon]
CLKGVRRVCLHDPYLEELAGMRVERNLAEALKGADLAIFMVAHEEYVKLTPSALKKAMRRPAIVDGRNIFSQKKMVRAGFVYRGVGKSII